LGWDGDGLLGFEFVDFLAVLKDLKIDRDLAMDS
jgi:hypothetical protein